MECFKVGIRVRCKKSHRQRSDLELTLIQDEEVVITSMFGNDNGLFLVKFGEKEALFPIDCLEPILEKNAINNVETALQNEEPLLAPDTPASPEDPKTFNPIVAVNPQINEIEKSQPLIIVDDQKQLQVNDVVVGVNTTENEALEAAELLKIADARTNQITEKMEVEVSILSVPDDLKQKISNTLLPKVSVADCTSENSTPDVENPLPDLEPPTEQTIEDKPNVPVLPQGFLQAIQQQQLKAVPSKQNSLHENDEGFVEDESKKGTVVKKPLLHLELERKITEREIDFNIEETISKRKSVLTKIPQLDAQLQNFMQVQKDKADNGKSVLNIETKINANKLQQSTKNQVSENSNTFQELHESMKVNLPKKKPGLKTNHCNTEENLTELQMKLMKRIQKIETSQDENELDRKKLSPKKPIHHASIYFENAPANYHCMPPVTSIILTTKKHECEQSELYFDCEEVSENIALKPEIPSPPPMPASIVNDIQVTSSPDIPQTKSTPQLKASETPRSRLLKQIHNGVKLRSTIHSNDTPDPGKKTTPSLRQSLHDAIISRRHVIGDDDDKIDTEESNDVEWDSEE